MREQFDDFIIPSAPASLLNALEETQRKYEAAKIKGEQAVFEETRASENVAALKRDTIKRLTDSGTAITRAEKEYVDDAQYKDAAQKLADLTDDKREVALSESIYRNRMLTLRAALLPVTFFAMKEIQATAMHPLFGDVTGKNVIGQAMVSVAEDGVADRA